MDYQHAAGAPCLSYSTTPSLLSPLPSSIHLCKLILQPPLLSSLLFSLHFISSPYRHEVMSIFSLFPLALFLCLLSTPFLSSPLLSTPFLSSFPLSTPLHSFPSTSHFSTSLLECYEKAWKLEFEASAAAGFKLAFCYLKCRKFVEAIDVCEIVLELYPDYPRIREEILKKAILGVRSQNI